MTTPCNAKPFATGCEEIREVCNWGEPHLVLLLGEMYVCNVRHQCTLSPCTNSHALADPNVHKPVTTGILSVLSVHVLQSVESSMESYKQPRSPLTKSGQTSEETSRQRREQRASHYGLHSLLPPHGAAWGQCMLCWCETERPSHSHCFFVILYTCNNFLLWQWPIPIKALQFLCGKVGLCSVTFWWRSQPCAYETAHVQHVHSLRLAPQCCAFL